MRVGGQHSHRCDIVGMAVELVDVTGVGHVHLVDACMWISRDGKQLAIRRNSEEVDGLHAWDDRYSMKARHHSQSYAYRIWILHRAKREPAVDLPESDGVIISRTAFPLICLTI